MKNRIIVTVALVLIAGCACAQKVIPELKGEYRVDGFKRNTAIDFETFKSNGMAFGRVAFNFLDNDSVIVSKTLGNRMFGCTVLKYELTDSKLILTNKDKRFEIPYTNNGVFKLKVTDEYLVEIDLVPLNTPFNSAAQRRANDSTGIIRAPSYL